MHRSLQALEGQVDCYSQYQPRKVEDLWQSVLSALFSPVRRMALYIYSPSSKAKIKHLDAVNLDRLLLIR